MVTLWKKIGWMAMGLTMLSCNSWLEVEPSREASEEDMYANTKGFYSVLNGLYLEMGKSELYGRNLSWGEVGAWARVYKLNDQTSAHETFISFRDFDYKTKKVEKVIAYIWEEGYRIIARTNNLLEHIELQDSTFFENGSVERNVLLGEALAVRAFMHFDLARVFAQAPAVEADGKYIPYVTVYPSLFNPALPTSELLENVIKDLKRSKSLLATYDTLPRNMPFLTQAANRFDKKRLPDWGKFYACRGNRLNYYAVTGLLARVYLYAGQHQLALEQATEITRLTQGNTLTMTGGAQITLDPKMMDGVLFCLYNKDLVKSNETFTDGGTSSLYAEDALLFNPGEGSVEEDGRKQLLSNGILTKYMESKGKTYGECIPLMRLSEICYIAGECYLLEDDMTNAIAMLDLVRKARGGKALPASLEKGAYMDKLVNDARKDLIGEGQLLFLFKRLNTMYYSGGSKYDPNGKLVLPKPNSESAI